MQVIKTEDGGKFNFEEMKVRRSKVEQTDELTN